MPIQIVAVTNESQLTDSLCEAWNRLPMPTPMQSADWLVPWWKVFGNNPNYRLCILLAYDEDTLVAVAPWYVATNWMSSACLRFLGDGMICTDHATIPIREGYRDRVVESIADWLQLEAGRRWHTIKLESIDDDDSVLRQLFDILSDSGCVRHARKSAACWTIDLPETWEQYLTGLSKVHRKRCRRWQREYFDTGRAEIHIRTVDDFEEAWYHLAQLNEERRNHLGDRSAFLDLKFHEFHLAVLDRLIPQAKAEIRELHVDGQLKAMEYLLKQDGALYCYQSGMTMEGATHGYGNLSILALFRDAIDEGCTKLDFLRGDETYKQHWRAIQCGCSDYHMAANSLAGKTSIAYFRTLDQVRDLRASLIGSA